MMNTTIYIDAANIILSAKNVGVDLDMLKLAQHLKDKFRTEKIVYFTGNFRSKHAEFQTLKDTGIKMVFKEIFNEENKAKANCDVEIAHKITFDILRDTVDRIVLVSGDGDFACLYDFAQSKGKEVKAIAFDSRSCSRVIKRRAFAKVSFIIEWKDFVAKEKPPAGT